MWIEVRKVDSTFQVPEEYLDTIDRCLKCCFVAKIANMMSEDKILSTESENVNVGKDLESEIATIMNNRAGPYWNKQHPDHDKSVQQVYTLREMANSNK